MYIYISISPGTSFKNDSIAFITLIIFIFILMITLIQPQEEGKPDKVWIQWLTQRRRRLLAWGSELGFSGGQWQVAATYLLECGPREGRGTLKRLVNVQPLTPLTQALKVSRTPSVSVSVSVSVYLLFSLFSLVLFCDVHIRCIYVDIYIYVKLR